MPKTQAVRAGGASIGRLDLTCFRNYRALQLDIPAGKGALVVLTGDNGAGKTNLLEAISYLAPGRGLRGARLTDVTLRGHSGPWAVSGRFTTPSGAVSIGCGIEPSGEPSDEGRARRIVVVDSEKLSSPAALAPFVTILWLTPKMDRLFQEAPVERRRFFDQLVTGLFPEHAAQISAYEKAMRERLRLLTDPRTRPDEAWLAALERRMAEHAVAIAAARLEMLELIQAHLPFANAGAFPLPEVGLDGDIEGLVAAMPALQAEDAYLVRLRETRGQDRDAGRTQSGPHKTDLTAVHGDKGMTAGECSTGEQKAMLIGIILAAVRLQAAARGRAPILLLDEVAAHLDGDRREALFQEIETLSIQAWMTGTDRKLFAPLQRKAAFFGVVDGVVTAAK